MVGYSLFWGPEIPLGIMCACVGTVSDKGSCVRVMCDKVVCERVACHKVICPL